MVGSARIDFFRQIGLDRGCWPQFQKFMASHGVGPILKSSQIKYKYPVTFPDTLLIGSSIPPKYVVANSYFARCSTDVGISHHSLCCVSAIGPDRFVMAHRAVSQRHGCLVADMSAVIVSYDYKHRQKAPLPAYLATEFKSFMNAHLPHAPHTHDSKPH
jgi:acyl-CoA thioesterase FadM